MGFNDVAHNVTAHARGMLPKSQVNWGNSDDPIYMHPCTSFPLSCNRGSE
jgi:hypothetical protein